MRVLGFMSGTSLDAVDLAIIETDGERVVGLGAVSATPLPTRLRTLLQSATETALAWPRDSAPPAIFSEAGRAIAEFQAGAARDFLARAGEAPGSIELAGFHGQTVLHERPDHGRPGRTLQLGDAALLARLLDIPVVYDLRVADVAAGGQGAPMAPVYHAALAAYSGLATPVVVLNLGGISNPTFVAADGTITAFDAGPANGPIDQLVERHGRGRCDRDGLLALAGRVDETRIAEWLRHPYFRAFEPKSLDRYEFGAELVDDLSLEDGVATLTAFCAACVAHAFDQAPDYPTRVVVCGGGRHNPAIMAQLRSRLKSDVVTAEDVGWRGDFIEAEAWAFMAARSVKGLPISFPGTTGVTRPTTGGELARP